jgi:MtfA peptidase
MNRRKGQPMAFSRSKTRRRNQLLAEPFPAAWNDYLVNNVRHYAHLDPLMQSRVKAVVSVMVAEKHWSGGGGFTVTDEMKVTVAAQASLLALGLDEPYFFDRVQSIIIYPDVYVHPPQFARHWNVLEGVPVAGEAWYHSPIVLSWKYVLDAGRNTSSGRNVVLHEFAHHLDGLDGEVNGAPPLVGRRRAKTWYRVTEAEYRRLAGAARRREVTLLDHYGASSRAEFFAVATECFFEQPGALRRQHGELYAVLQDFYRQDPAQWLPDAAVTAPADDPQTAEAAAQTDAAALDPDDVDALFTLAFVCMSDGRYELAQQAASRAIDLDPDDAEVYLLRAAARIKLGKHEEALNDCDESIAMDPSDMDAYRTRGAAYVGLHEYELAKDDLDRVVSILSDNCQNAEAYCVRGMALLGLGEVRRAVSDFSKSIAIDPLSAETYYQRGLAYRKLGRTEDANADLEKARQIDPAMGQRH